jgi:hypothetical protein
MNPITAHINGYVPESRMTDAEAVYTAQEAADKLATAHAAIRKLLDNFGDTPFDQLNDLMSGVELHLYQAETAEAEVKSALAKIKVRETVDG